MKTCLRVFLCQEIYSFIRLYERLFGILHGTEGLSTSEQYIGFSYTIILYYIINKHLLFDGLELILDL